MPKEEPSKLSTSLAIVGLVVVLLIVIWGLIHVATVISPWFSSLFAAKPSATLSVQAPSAATSSEAFTLRWTYEPAAEGSYALLYPCNDSLRFETPSPRGDSNVIPCGAAFSLTGTSLSLTPYLSGTSAIAAPLTVLYLASSTGATVAQGSASVKVRPSAKPVPVVKGAPSAAQTIGPSDLAVSVISATVDQTGWGVLVFDVENIGPNSSGPYTFQANLPTQTGYIYYSPAQSSLSPGSHIINTLRFTQAIPGAASVIVDPANTVDDMNRTNNYGAAQLTAPYGLSGQSYDPQPQYDYWQTYYQQPIVY